MKYFQIPATNNWVLLEAILAHGFNLGYTANQEAVNDSKNLFLKSKSYQFWKSAVITHSDKDFYSSPTYFSDSKFSVDSLISWQEFFQLTKEDCQDSVIVKLNDDYSVTVHPDRVVVGCQTIPKDKVLEILKVIERVMV